LEQMDEASTADTNESGESGLTETQNSALERALSYANLAEGLIKKDKTLLETIGAEVVKGYENDNDSRREWLERNKNYMKLATQVMERKTWPWDGAANVKYPLLTTAALQFASRAFGSLIPSFDVVKAKVIGADPDGQMTMLANKLSTHMSYEVMYKVEDWEENMDKLCFVLPIVGTMFKRVYYSEYKKAICSELLGPKDVVVNYYVKKLKDASRITEVQWYTANEVKECQNRGEWLDDTEFGPGDGTNAQTLSEDKTTGLRAPTPDEETPRQVLVQYCRIDLDDDGYKEPYIVTVDYATNKVVRIVANFYPDSITFKDDKKKEVACIEPAQWFVKFDFLPNPDGGFYGIGFGILLGGLNDMVNTVTNQLLDSATLANLQAGFIGRGLRDNKQKQMNFRPGEWKWVNNPGKDLKENIFPLPVREPSQTLFNLLGTLVTSGKEVASVADIFTGKMPGQNTPASTTMATIEQGLKVFTSIYKRIYRSMGQEFCLMFDLMKKYAPSEAVVVVGKMNGNETPYSVSKFDYQQASNQDIKIIPSADPNMVSETQKLVKIQGLYELAQFGTINMQEMTKQALVYQGQDNIQGLLQVPPPQPDPEVEMKKQELQGKMQIEQQKMQFEKEKMEMEKQMMVLEMQIKKQEAELEIQKMQMEMHLKREEMQMGIQHKQQEHALNMEVSKQTAMMDMQTQKQMNEQDISHNEEKNQKDIEIMGKKADAQAQIAKKKEIQTNARKGPVG
jgi:chaperonin GroES